MDTWDKADQKDLEDDWYEGEIFPNSDIRDEEE
jgi:hypothetical protein